MMKKILVGAAAVAILSTGAFAATINSDPGLYAIGVLDAGTPYSVPMGIDVSDGKVYTAGTSYSATWSGNHPFIGVLDSSSSSIIEIPNPSGDGNSKAQGVSVALSNNQIAAGGTVGGIGRSYIAPLNDIANGSWSTMYGSDAQCEGMNVNRTSESENDRTEVVGRNTKNNRGLRVRMAVGPWSSSVGEYLPLNGTKVKALSISTNRTMYGQEEGTPRSSDAVYTSGINTSVTRVPMADPSERSLAYGISENAQFMCGMQYNTAASWVYDAFVWDTSDASATILPVSSTWEVNPAAYAVNSQGIVAGRGYNSIDGETAGIWPDKNSELITIADLAASYGIDTSDWTNFKRLYAISDVQDDGKYAISGYGTWAADGTSRGFVLVVPEPATLSFLALGGLALLRRRR